MDRTFWHKQTVEQPLYPDLLWSRPENKKQAGKLLIAGGNAHGFAAAGEAYGEAVKAGIGTARVLLPDSLQKTVGRVFEAGEYAPSTPSGSFSQRALAELLAMGQWADAVLLAGDLGRNSETAILLEQFIGKYSGQLALTKDAIDYFVNSPSRLLARQNTLLVLSFAQLQKLAASARFAKAFTSDMDFLRLIEALHEFTKQHQAAIIVKHLQTIFVAVNGQVSSTKLSEDIDIWHVKTASAAAVWWLQNPAKSFEALTTSLITK
jgi:NAD(P)H-hydrate repair Nnr-like enzyme with NAD(P)H-hydrate dehydratase domain